jgi:hypothetical protein
MSGRHWLVAVVTAFILAGPGVAVQAASWGAAALHADSGAMADDPIDRTRLPITDPAFMGVANRSLDGSRPEWRVPSVGCLGPSLAPHRPARSSSSKASSNFSHREGSADLSRQLKG